MPVLLLLLILVIVVFAWRHSASRKAGGPLRPRFVGPDDDPDFLRELDRRSRRDDDQP